MTRITTRPYSLRESEMLRQNGMHPVLARLYAARGVLSETELSTELSAMLPPSGLLQIEKAAVFLADAIAARKKAGDRCRL
jgi:single-stranded-DNA-specific exonuclease